MLHLRGGRGAISREHYPDLAVFWDDVGAAYRAAIAHIAAAGCTYLQLDDVSFSYLCDPVVRDGLRAGGDDPAALPRTYAAAINQALAGRPAGMTVTMHTCRGNFRSTWLASGGYEDAVVEAMFSTDVDAYFMEWDSERAGGFEPLRLLPRGKTVVLGLVTTKSGALEPRTRWRAGSTRPRATFPSTACACRPSAASRARTTAIPSPRTSSGESSSAWSRSRARSGAHSQPSTRAARCESDRLLGLWPRRIGSEAAAALRASDVRRDGRRWCLTAASVLLRRRPDRRRQSPAANVHKRPLR